MSGILPGSQSGEVPPIDPEELLLRRISRMFYPDPDHPKSPQWIAFRPTDKDLDGLSVGRRRLVVSIEQFSYAPDHTKQHCVAQVGASQVFSLGLSVVPKPIQGDRSHAIIPEMNVRDYKADKAKKLKIQEWASRLANDYSQMVLVLPVTQAG
jgi:hypothetical protein